MTRNHSTTALPPAARRYLDDLEHELRDLPAARRSGIIADITAHLSDELATPPDSDSEPGVAPDVYEVLDRLGTPADIARSARAELPGEGVRMAGRDVATIVLLLAGGFAFGVGWIVGAVLLWTSNTWRLSDKLIGTLLVPGGLATAAALTVLHTSSSGSLCVVGVDGETTCSVTHSGLPPAVGITLLAIAVLGPIATAIWLSHQARRSK